jgi:hypothetical protein
MRRIIGPILGVLGILIVIGLVAGAAYSAGLAAAGVVTTSGTTVVAPVAPVAAYGWYGIPWIGFGIFHFLAFLFVIVLIFGLLRLAFGGGRRGRGYGWGYGHGYGPTGWDRGHEAGDRPSADPREAWIRSRLDEWHQTAHPTSGAATPGSTSTGPASAPADTTGQEPPPPEG